MLIHFAAWKLRSILGWLVSRYRGQAGEQAAGAAWALWTPSTISVNEEPVVVDYKTSQRGRRSPRRSSARRPSTPCSMASFIDDLWRPGVDPLPDRARAIPKIIHIDDALLDYARTLVESIHQKHHL